MKLILAARDPDKLTALADELPPGSVVGICAGDLSESGAQCALVRLARAEDAAILINLCGGNRFALLDESDRPTMCACADHDESDRADSTHAGIATAPAEPLGSDDRQCRIGVRRDRISRLLAVLREQVRFAWIQRSAGARTVGLRAVRVVYVAPRATRTGMNSDAASALNAALGNAEDPPRTGRADGFSDRCTRVGAAPASGGRNAALPR